MMTNTYKFIHHYRNDDGIERNCTLETTGTTWTELVEQFTRFLRGCGFILNGEFEFVPDDNNADDDTNDPQN